MYTYIGNIDIFYSFVMHFNAVIISEIYLSGC